MTEQEAKQIIYNALNVATLKGCYNLEEAIHIVDAWRIVVIKDKD